ncbi:DinB family protein [Nocardioides koreensis]|uniref:DinB family protein n=1 Tax=Nocardioides koreensis TaxID=433651 RepID=A0ABP5LUZ2_9ACTN
MTDDHRSEATLTGTEREQLEAFLHDNRLEIAALLDGVTEEQARRRLVPSLTTLLALVKHATFVEKAWFHCSLAGRTRTEAGIPEDAQESFVTDDSDTVESVLAGYRRAWAEADAIAAAYDLDDLAVHNRRGPLTLRWIYVHMVEELARHAGHGDILREQILAADTG